MPEPHSQDSLKLSEASSALAGCPEDDPVLGMEGAPWNGQVPLGVCQSIDASKGTNGDAISQV